MIRLFYLLILTLSFLIAKESFSTKKTHYILISDLGQVTPSKSNEFITTKQIQNISSDWQKLAKQSPLHAKLTQTPLTTRNESIEAKHRNFDISTTELEHSFYSFIRSHPLQNDPIRRGNFLMAMSTIERFKPLVRSIAMEIAKEKQFERLDPHSIETQQDLNTFLSDNEEYEAVIMSYQAYLNTYDGMEVDLLNETFDLIEYHNNDIIRKDIANAFVDSYPEQYDALIQMAHNHQVTVDGVKKIEIPTINNSENLF